MERTIAIIQKIENYIAEESNMMGDFIRDLKAFVDKHVHKKILKLYSSDSVWKQKTLINEEKAINQEDIFKYSQNLKSLVLKYSDFGAKMYEEGREVYRSFVEEVKLALRENCKFFRKLQNTHYSEEEYGKSYQ